MNNTIGMNGRINTKVKAERKAPVWIVMLAHFILWLTKAETVRSLRAGTALVVLAVIVAFAAGIGMGTVPFLHGAIITTALAAIALMLTRDLA